MRLFTKGVVAFLCLLQLPLLKGNAQPSPAPLAPGYYVVVAAYRLGQDAYAKNYISTINHNEGIEAQYGADLGRKYLYVYLDYYKDFDESIKEMLSARKKAGFEEAWVRIMKEGMGTPINLLTETAPTDKENQPTAVVASNNKSVIVPPEPEGQKEMEEVEKTVGETQLEAKGIEEKQIETELEFKEAASMPEGEEEVAASEPKPVESAQVYLSLYNATNNDQIDGEVEVIDVDRARLVEKVKANEYIHLPDPKSKSGEVSLVANVFGYRPIQHDIFYNQVPADSTSHFMEWDGNHYVIKFGLSRYHKGDINTLYNVFFYNDAAIMLPESKYQLNSLLEMMKENPRYKIMLHGHTNGKARGRIITMGPSQSFFSLANDVKVGNGSAKELSKERAEVIKEWLVAQGVAEDRIEVKAWGGARMIYDKNSANAKKNVRVDVEILEE